LSTALTRRSAAPWLFGLSLLLVLLSPIVFFGVLSTADSDGDVLTAIVATLADLAAAVFAAVVATVLAMRRGLTRVRTAVTGHPQGRAGLVAEQHAARWLRARDRFDALCVEYAAFETDPGALARRPALTEVSQPATAEFFDAFHDARVLRHEAEHAEWRRGEFVAAVDRVEAAWQEAQRVADELAAGRGRP
jgi:hypothetical protein